MQKDLEKENVIRLLKTYGADTNHWPPERASALTHAIETHQDINSLYAREAALDARLKDRFEPATSELAGRIFAEVLASKSAPRTGHYYPKQSIVRQSLAASFGLAACLMIGVFSAATIEPLNLWVSQNESGLAYTSLDVWTLTE